MKIDGGSSTRRGIMMPYLENDKSSPRAMDRYMVSKRNQKCPNQVVCGYNVRKDAARFFGFTKEMTCAHAVNTGLEEVVAVNPPPASSLGSHRLVGKLKSRAWRR